MHVGLTTLGDHLPNPHSGRYNQTQAGRHREIVETAVRAESMGFHSIHIGEHHLCDYIVSSPPILLAAIAERTSRLRLSTAVTLTPTLDPLRVAEDYATVDVLSGGRVELMAGRGALSDTYDIFGQNIERSRELFAESLELLLLLWKQDTVTWNGEIRPPLSGQTLTPRPLQKPHPPVWVGAGSPSPHTFELAGRLGLPLILGNFFNPASYYADNVSLYQEHFVATGHDPQTMRVGTSSHVFVAADSQSARRKWIPYYDNYLSWLGDLLGGQAKPIPIDFRAESLMESSATCGSPAEVVDKILSQREALGVTTSLHLAMFDHGGIPERELLESMELFATEVLPQLSQA